MWAEFFDKDKLIWHIWDGCWYGQSEGADLYGMNRTQFQRFLGSGQIFGQSREEGIYFGGGEECLASEGKVIVSPRGAISSPYLKPGQVSSAILCEKVIPGNSRGQPRYLVFPVLSGANVGITFYQPQ